MMDVFINDAAAFLPNAPISNDEIENVLGKTFKISSKIRNIVLKNNRIKTRYYAIDPTTGRLTHTNARLTAEAVRMLNPHDRFDIRDIQCLCCGTSTPDLLFPGHALMVLGELNGPPCEAVTTSGICISGMTAFKYAWMNVAAGMSENAAAAGSELASSFIRSAFLKPLYDEKNAAGVIEKPAQAFDADFLRWMLSDGAGAVFLSSQRNVDRISLKIDWIENISFAGELDLCMYGGGVKKADGTVVGWRETENIAPAETPYLFSIRQDIKLLDKHIVSTMGAALSTVVKKHNLVPSDIAWWLPHYSSHYFRPKFYDETARIGFEIPYEKWFTNLTEKGNTGSAAIFIILEELFHSGKLNIGDKLLCFIPESGRFSHCFMMLTAV